MDQQNLTPKYPMHTPYFSAEMETDYQRNLAQEKIQITRKACKLTMIPLLAFGILDIWAIPDALFTVWAIRLAVCALIVIVLFLTPREEFFTRHYVSITVIQYLFYGVAIVTMIHFSNPGEIASLSYYAGLLLIIMALYSWTFLPTSHTVLIGMALLISYGVITVAHPNASLLVLAANCVFLIGANVIGFLSYVDRNQYFRENYLLRRSLQRELKLAEAGREQGEYLALHDPLTGLPNRLYLKHALIEAIERAKKDGGVVAVLFIDLDGFKPINDTYSHDVGDFVLRAISARLENSVRHDDIAGRFGGDEFVAVLNIPAENAYRDIQILARRFLFAIRQPVVVKNVCSLSISASIGIALYPYHERDAEGLISQADEQMYLAKQSGKNGISLVVTMDTHVLGI